MSRPSPAGWLFAVLVGAVSATGCSQRPPEPAPAVADADPPVPVGPSGPGVPATTPAAAEKPPTAGPPALPKEDRGPSDRYREVAEFERRLDTTDEFYRIRLVTWKRAKTAPVIVKTAPTPEGGPDTNWWKPETGRGLDDCFLAREGAELAVKLYEVRHPDRTGLHVVEAVRREGVTKDPRSFESARKSAVKDVEAKCAQRVSNVRTAARALEDDHAFLTGAAGRAREWATPVRRDLDAYLTDPVDPLWTLPLASVQLALEATGRHVRRGTRTGEPAPITQEHRDLGVILVCYLNYPAINTTDVLEQRDVSDQSSAIVSLLYGSAGWHSPGPQPPGNQPTTRAEWGLLRRVVEPYHAAYQKALAAKCADLGLTVPPGSVGESRVAIRKSFGADVEGYNRLLAAADEAAGAAFVDALRASLRAGRVPADECKLLLTRKHEGHRRSWLPSPLYAAVARLAGKGLPPDDPIAELVPYATGEKSALPPAPKPPPAAPPVEDDEARVGGKKSRPKP